MQDNCEMNGTAFRRELSRQHSSPDLPCFTRLHQQFGSIRPNKVYQRGGMRPESMINVGPFVRKCTRMHVGVRVDS